MMPQIGTGSASDAERKTRVFCDRPGRYAVRLAKGAVEVALEIIHQPTPDPFDGQINWERPHWWVIQINGDPVGEPSLTFPHERDYFGRPIDDDEFEFLVEHRQWARNFAPDRPEARIYERVDFNNSPVLF